MRQKFGCRSAQHPSPIHNISSVLAGVYRNSARLGGADSSPFLGPIFDERFDRPARL